MSPCLGGVVELLKEVIFVYYVTLFYFLFAVVLLATLRLFPLKGTVHTYSSRKAQVAQPSFTSEGLLCR